MLKILDFVSHNLIELIVVAEIEYPLGMFALSLILLGNIALTVASLQYNLRTIDMGDKVGDKAVLNEAMWGDSAGNLYVSELYCRNCCQVRKIDSNGRVTIIVGANVSGDSWVTGLYGDSKGEILYMSQKYEDSIWRHNISSNTTIRIAGKGPFSHSRDFDPLNDGGPALSSPMNPTSLFLSSTGMLYFCDPERQRVRVINTENQIINTFAGNHDRTLTEENVPATSFWLFRPTGVWGDSLGFIFIADRSSNKVRRVNPAGIISTFAGNGRYAGEWTSRRHDPKVPQSELGDNGPATLASLEYPYDVKGDKEGNIFIAEWTGCRVRMISSNIITTIIGSDKCRYATYDVQYRIGDILDPIWSLWVVNKHKFYFSERGRLTLATSVQKRSQTRNRPLDQIPYNPYR